MTVESSNSMGYSGGETRRLKISKPRVDDNDSGYAHAHRFCCVTNFSSCCATKTVMIFFFPCKQKNQTNCTEFPCSPRLQVPEPKNRCCDNPCRPVGYPSWREQTYILQRQNSQSPSLAWSLTIAGYLTPRKKAKSVFSTHVCRQTTRPRTDGRHSQPADGMIQTSFAPCGENKRAN